MKQRKPLRRTPITRKTPMPRVGKQAKRPGLAVLVVVGRVAPAYLHVCGFGNLDGCHGDIHQEPIWAKTKGYTVESHEDPASARVLRRGEWVRLLDDGTWVPTAPSEWVGGAA